MAKAPPVHPVENYARGVVAGLILCGEHVVLACRRHLDDLENARGRGFYFDPDEADYAIEFFGFLRHVKGEWSGQIVILDPWQVFIVGSIFGWRRVDDGTRRFRTAYIEVPRKNGKSTLAAGIGLFCFLADGEPGAEVYSAATKREQAKIVFSAASAMVRKSRGLSSRVVSLHQSLSMPASESVFLPLAADSKTMDGLNVHCAVLDELHAHPNRDIVDVIDTATGSRRQPLIFEITTAGFDRHSVCWEHHDYSIQVLEGNYNDVAADSWFAYIAGCDDKDAWDDPKTWAKANPGYGISVKPDDLARLCAKAQQMPAAQSAFEQKRLDRWTEQAERWLDMDLWRAGGELVDPDEMAGRDCIGGLDLARVNDLTALAHIFPPVAAGEKWKIWMRFFVPAEDIAMRSKRDKVPYVKWRNQGFIEPTPGNTTDFAFVEAAILEAAARFNLMQLAYDRTFAGQLVNNLTDEGILMVPFGQGFVSMGEACADFLRLLLAGELQHGNNPVLAWNAANVTVRRDPSGNEKPDKDRSRERIDGIVAVIMGLRRALLGDPDEVPFIRTGEQLTMV